MVSLLPDAAKIPKLVEKLRAELSSKLGVAQLAKKQRERATVNWFVNPSLAISRSEQDRGAAAVTQWRREVCRWQGQRRRLVRTGLRLNRKQHALTEVNSGLRLTKPARIACTRTAGGRAAGADCRAGQ